MSRQNKRRLVVEPKPNGHLLYHLRQSEEIMVVVKTVTHDLLIDHPVEIDEDSVVVHLNAGLRMIRVTIEVEATIDPAKIDADLLP
jgi:hypothetical protein